MHQHHIRTCVRTHVRTYIHTYMHTYIITCTYITIYIYLLIYLFICLFIYRQKSLTVCNACTWLSWHRSARYWIQWIWLNSASRQPSLKGLVFPEDHCLA